MPLRLTLGKHFYAGVLSIDPPTPGGILSIYFLSFKWFHRLDTSMGGAVLRPALLFFPAWTIGFSLVVLASLPGMAALHPYLQLQLLSLLSSANCTFPRLSSTLSVFFTTLIWEGATHLRKCLHRMWTFLAMGGPRPLWMVPLLGC